MAAADDDIARNGDILKRYIARQNALSDVQIALDIRIGQRARYGNRNVFGIALERQPANTRCRSYSARCPYSRTAFWRFRLRLSVPCGLKVPFV